MFQQVNKFRRVVTVGGSLLSGCRYCRGSLLSGGRYCRGLVSVGRSLLSGCRYF